MKTAKKFIFAVVLVLVTALTAIALTGCAPEDDFAKYIGKVSAYKAKDGSDLFKNTNDEAYAQTVVHDMIMKHFESPLAEGKTTKKAIFLGYDGCRVDVLKYANDQPDGKSALLKVRDMGTLVFAYAGGPNGDESKNQATSTAPGWASMLTGKWALEEGGHGVNDNGLYKKSDVETFLTKIAKMTNPFTGKTYNSSFTTSWRHHQSVTYRDDIVLAIENGTTIDYTHCEDDEATYYDVLQRVCGQEKYAPKDTDAVFLTLEGTDHAGHDIGFGIQHEEYINGFLSEDAYGYEIIKTIENRPNYATEDWLFVMSTDHGGYKKSHGGQTVLERTTWIATNRPEYLA